MSKLIAAAAAAGLLWTAAERPGEIPDERRPSNPPATYISAADILATIANAPEGRVSDQQIRHIDAGWSQRGRRGGAAAPQLRTLGAIQHHNQSEVYYVVSGRGNAGDGRRAHERARALDPERRKRFARSPVRVRRGRDRRRGESVEIGPGDMLIIPAGSPHGFSEVVGDDHLHRRARGPRAACRAKVGAADRHPRGAK